VTIETAMRDAEHKMDQALTHMKDDLGSIRTGRAAPAVLSRVTVEYYALAWPATEIPETIDWPGATRLTIEYS